MIRFQQTAIISGSVEKVFAYIANPNNIPDWRKDVPGISRVSGETKVGATFCEEVNFFGKKRLLMKVIEFTRDKKLVIAAQSGMPLLPTQSFSFLAEARGTKIDLEVVMNVSGPFKLIQFLLPRQLGKIWKGYFEELYGKFRIDS